MRSPNKLGELIRRGREALGVSQAKAARAAGRTGPFVAQIEAGKVRPTDIVLAGICDGLAIERAEAFLDLAEARGYHRVPWQGNARDAELARLAAADPVRTVAEGGRP